MSSQRDRAQEIIEAVFEQSGAYADATIEDLGRRAWVPWSHVVLAALAKADLHLIPADLLDRTIARLATEDEYDELLRELRAVRGE